MRRRKPPPAASGPDAGGSAGQSLAPLASEALRVYANAAPRSFDVVIDEVRSGLPYQALERLQAAAGLNQAEVASLVGIPERTIVRRKGEGRLTPAESDRVDRIVRLLELATRVLEDEGNARRWLHRPNRGLGGKAPLELLDTDRGVRAVEDVLMRIEHGIYG